MEALAVIPGHNTGCVLSHPASPGLWSPAFLWILQAARYPPNTSLFSLRLQESVSVVCTSDVCPAGTPDHTPFLNNLSHLALSRKGPWQRPDLMGCVELEENEHIGRDYCSTTQIIGTGLHVLNFLNRQRC